jgi:transposase-like protein
MVARRNRMEPLHGGTDRGMATTDACNRTEQTPEKTAMQTETMGRTRVPRSPKEEIARLCLEGNRWGDDPFCPHCLKKDGQSERRRNGDLGDYMCRHCKRMYNVRTGTALERSHVPMSKWIQAIHLIAVDEARARSAWLSDCLEVGERTARKMLRSIRRIFAERGTGDTGNDFLCYVSQKFGEPPGGRPTRSEEGGARAMRLILDKYAATKPHQDHMYMTQQRNPGHIYSHMTALSLNNATNCMPWHYEMTAPNNAQSQPPTIGNHRVFYADPDYIGLGLTKMPTIFGNEVETYDTPRAMYQCLQDIDCLVAEYVYESLADYLDETELGEKSIMDYAALFHTEEYTSEHIEIAKTWGGTQ